jgi:hypothetical protein
MIGEALKDLSKNLFDIECVAIKWHRTLRKEGIALAEIICKQNRLRITLLDYIVLKLRLLSQPCLYNLET